MVRATNNFDRQVRAPVLAKDKLKNNFNISQVSNSPSHISGLGFDFQKSMADGKTKVMNDEQMVAWYAKVLEGVKARYRKLQKFARSVVPFHMPFALLMYLYTEIFLIDLEMLRNILLKMCSWTRSLHIWWKVIIS